MRVSPQRITIPGYCCAPQVKVKGTACLHQGAHWKVQRPTTLNKWLQEELTTGWYLGWWEGEMTTLLMPKSLEHVDILTHFVSLLKEQEYTWASVWHKKPMDERTSARDRIFP